MKSELAIKAKEHIRHALLMQLEAAYPVTLPLDTLCQGLHLAGHKIEPEELVKELEYLTEKGFLKTLARDICPYSKRYKLATKGVDYLESVELI